MDYLVTGKEMAAIDAYSIQEIGIPGIVLMERAALSIVEELEKSFCFDRNVPRVLIVVEKGNNGGDGLAVARLLIEKGAEVDIYEIGAISSMTESYAIQKNILEKLGIDFVEDLDSCLLSVGEGRAYDLIIDGIFGVGLHRPVEGIHREVIRTLNAMQAMKLAIDIPTGIDAATGKILGCAFEADLTVTFGCNKRGLVLFPGADLAGKVVTKDIGFPGAALAAIEPEAICFGEEDLALLPVRPAHSHKGSFGRVLMIAGSKNMAGAAYLAATAAYRTGAGLVEIFTCEENRSILQTLVPGAIMTTFEETAELVEKLAVSLSRASVVCVGPGLGINDATRTILQTVLKLYHGTVVVDADAINTFAAADTWLAEAFTGYEGSIILTPHLLEMSRISGMKLSDIKEDIVAAAKHYQQALQERAAGERILVVKDARTVVCGGGEKLYINLSGNSGMAKGGSGDVLSGIISGLISQGSRPQIAARLGVYVHGRAGDKACEKLGSYNMMAEDMLSEILV